MIRLSPPPSSDQDNATHELLRDLLSTQIPTEHAALRPVALRSVDEQRRMALSSFRLRSWVDSALHRLEWLLVAALIIFCAYWLIDGYGRDWLYASQQQRRAAASLAPSAPEAEQPETLAASKSVPAATADTALDGARTAAERDQPAALPFTAPNLERDPGAPDYLAPQVMAAPAETSDPRPQRLIVPAIGVDTPVTEVFIQDGVWQVADYAAGYHHGSALPGATGNTVMAGHAGLRGSVFRDLGQLQIGDEVLVEAGGWQYGYRVRAIKSVWPTQVEVMAPTSTPALTLITCTAWDTQRLIVVADLADSRPLMKSEE